MGYFEKSNKLPMNLFTVRVPIAATYTEAEIDLYGLPMDVEDGKTNKESYTNLTVAMFNTDRIIDTFIAGYPISLVKPEETKILYNILEEYIELHNVKVSRSLNVGEANDSRLQEIDRMLTEMFDYNKASIVKDLVNAPHGFAMNIGLAPTGNGIIGNRGSVNYVPPKGNDTSLASRYSKTTEQIPIMQNPMDNGINIDMSKVTRRRSYRSKSKSVTAADISSVNSLSEY